MNKQDWLDYFEAVNGRSATELELAKAIVDGEISELSEEATLFSNAQSVSNNANNKQSFSFQQIPGVNSAKVTEMKEKGQAFLSWFLTTLKNPTILSNPNPLYGFSTLVLSALLLAAAIVNYFSRILLSFANATVDGETLAQMEPEAYSRLTIAVKYNFGFGLTFKLGLGILLIYAIVVALLMFLNKKKDGTVTSFAQKASGYVFFAPALFVVNLLAFLSTFLIADKIVMSSSYFTRFSGIVMQSANPLGVLQSMQTLIKEAPTLMSIQNVATYLIVCSFIGLLLLLVSLVKNIDIEFGVFNKFYVVLFSLLVFLISVYFIDKYLLGLILKALEALYLSVSSLG